MPNVQSSMWLVNRESEREAERHLMDASLAASLERVVTLKEMLAFPSPLLHRSWEGWGDTYFRAITVNWGWHWTRGPCHTGTNMLHRLLSQTPLIDGWIVFRSALMGNNGNFGRKKCVGCVPVRKINVWQQPGECLHCPLYNQTIFYQVGLHGILELLHV